MAALQQNRPLGTRTSSAPAGRSPHPIRPPEHREGAVHSIAPGRARPPVGHDGEIDAAGGELITTWGLLQEAVGFTRQRLEEGLEQVGVSAAFFDVLVRLAREPSQRLPMTKLAMEVSLTSGGFTKLADRMEQEGFLYRQHSAQDRRVIYAVLTDAGRAAAAKVFPTHVSDLNRHVLDVLGPDGAAQLSRLARKLRDANMR